MMSLQTVPPISVLAPPHIFSDLLIDDDKSFDQKLLDQYITNIELLRKEFITFSYHYKKKIFKKLHDGEIKDLLCRYHNYCSQIAFYYKWFQSPHVGFLTLELEKNIRHIFPSHKVEEIVMMLTTLREMDVVMEEAKLALELSLYKNLSEEILWAYAEKFPWLFNRMYDRRKILEVLQRKFARLSLLSLRERKKRLKNIREDLQQKQKKYQGILTECYGDPVIVALANSLERLILEKAKLKACLDGAEYLFLDLFEAVAQRIGITLTELMSYSIKDIIAFFDKSS